MEVIMKRFAYTFAALLAVLACTEKEPDVQNAESVIFVKIAQPQTKTQIGTSGKVAWTAEDRISVFSDADKEHTEYVLKSGAGYSVASFAGEKVEGSQFYASYPSSARCDGKTFRTILPTRVSHSVPVNHLEGMPLFGSSRSAGDITVRPLCGVLEFNLTGNGFLKSVVLEAETAISGEMICNLADGLTAMSATASHIISMDASQTELSFFRKTPFHFILPPGEYENLSFTVTDSEGGVTVFTTDETIVIRAGEFTEATSVAPDVELIDMEFVSEKNGSGCFWYTHVAKNASFCVSYLYGITTREEFESYSLDAGKWLSEHGRTCTSSITDMQVLSPSTDYVALAQATSVSGSQDAPVVKYFTTPQIHHDASLALSVKTVELGSKSVTYSVSLPEGVEYLSDVYISTAQEFDSKTEDELVVKCLETRAKNRPLTGNFDSLLPGIDYVIYCVCDNEQSISDLAYVRFTTSGSRVGGGTEDIDEIEIN